jgi:hypothetical protein
MIYEKDLTIIADASDVFSDPDIYISKLPNPGNDFDIDGPTTIECSTWGLDLCILSNSDL